MPSYLSHYTGLAMCRFRLLERGNLHGANVPTIRVRIVEFDKRRQPRFGNADQVLRGA